MMNWLRKFFSGSGPIVALFVLLLASLYLMSDATHNSALFGQLYSVLLGINILAILLFIVLIGRSVWHLILQYRRQITGSRLTARLVVMFIILSVTPVSVVYYFSLDFLKRGIDSWFDVRVEHALNDALELSQASLGVRMTELLNQSKAMANSLQQTDESVAALALNDLHLKSEASELTLFTLAGRIIAASSDAQETLLPNKLEQGTQQVLRMSSSDVNLVPIKDAGLHVRVAVLVPPAEPGKEERILQALYPVPAHIDTLANSVQSAFGRYREVAYLRVPLKYSFILTLSLVLLLTLLMAIWAAFYAARRMVAPITDLVEGTRAVAAGDYEKRLPLPSRDELGVLVRSFNDMTHRIALARNEARDSQNLVEAQHAYLEAVLSNLTTGVITLDEDHLLHTSNPAASQILHIDLPGYQGSTLDQVAVDHPILQALADAVYGHFDQGKPDWQEEITLFSPEGRKVLMCRGTTLPDGHLVVFDDITHQIQAQRNAAWSEVARRLAHEIKNPLTPIQLSAERLRHKYMDKMPPEDAEVLDRSTHTIVQQVENLKEMVKAFSDYARMPALQLQDVDLNNLINEVMELYRGSNNHTRFRLILDDSAPHIEADLGRLRQVLHNLVKNAMEALPEQQGDITISTRCAEEHSCRYVDLKVEDSGPGFPDELFGQLFEPYITSKPKGSGLGLAIVKKIVEEHGGMLWAENKPGGGASVMIRLPVLRMLKDEQILEAEKQPEPLNSENSQSEPDPAKPDDDHAAA